MYAICANAQDIQTIFADINKTTSTVEPISFKY